MPAIHDILNEIFYDRKTLLIQREIKEVTLTVTTTGGDAAATGSAVSDVLVGALHSVKLDFHASAPATTDTTLSDAFNGNMLVVSNSATDATYRPVAPTHDSAGAAIATAYVSYALNGALTLSVAGCDALTGAVVATIRYVPA